MDTTTDDTTTAPETTLRRRNSIVTPSTTSTATSTSSTSDFELISLRPASYTSLRDILPSGPNTIMSPKAPSFIVHSGYEISIRNRLVKQAAWAYLQPMSSSPDSGGQNVFHRLWTRFSDVFLRIVTHIYDCLFVSQLKL
nr:hypothetical protein [Tanacetum cinerariifolium]